MISHCLFLNTLYFSNVMSFLIATICDLSFHTTKKYLGLLNSMEYKTIYNFP